MYTYLQSIFYRSNLVIIYMLYILYIFINSKFPLQQIPVKRNFHYNEKKFGPLEFVVTGFYCVMYSLRSLQHTTKYIIHWTT